MQKLNLMKRTISFILILLTTIVSLGRENHLEQYNISYLNIMTGLPDNFVSDIYTDSYGFVWIATHSGGLVRYDGYTYLYLGIGHKGLSLRSNSCRNVTEDHFHRLWISFDEGTDIVNLNTMLPESLKQTVSGYNLQKILSERSVKVYTDTKGFLWLITMNHIYRFSFTVNGTISGIKKLNYVGNTPDVMVMDNDKDGEVWVAINNILFKLGTAENSLKVIRRLDVLKNTGAHYISGLIKYAGKIWIGTNSGLYAMQENGRGLTSYHHSVVHGSLSHDFVSCLLVQNNQLLIGTYDGVNILNPDQKTFTLWNSHDPRISLSSDFVHCIYSSNGNLWVGTESGGITKLSPRQLLLKNFIHTDNPTSISPNAVNAMLVDRKGRLWVGIVEGGLNMKNSGSSNFIHFTTSNSRLTHNSVSVLTMAGSDNLWIGTWGKGINRMNINYPASLVPLKVPRRYQPLFNFVGTLTYDKINRGMWIGTNDGLFFYNLKTNQIQEPFSGCRNIRGCIGSIITRDGKLYVGCLEGMVVVNLKLKRKGYFSYTQYIHKLDAPKTNIIDKICCFYETHDGTLWLGSNGYGLYKQVRDKRGRVSYICYSSKDGLANNSVKGIIEDSKGGLWITTDCGLSQLNPKTGVFTNFTANDGLASSQFYYNSAVKGSDGQLYLGTIKGVTELEGENHCGGCKGHLRFTGLTIDQNKVTAGSRFLDKDISIADHICMCEGDKAMTIDFSALNYGSIPEVYCYRMKGFENEWIPLQPGQHSVRYTNLPSGDYEFEVKLASASDMNEDNHISIGVHVSPYFWKSWWFVLIEIVVVSYLARYFYLKRIKKLHEEEVEELYQPIEFALKESEDPEKLQVRIQEILNSQKRYAESRTKSVEATKMEVEEKNVPFMDRLMKVVEENYCNSEFGITELGEKIGMSRSALSRKINSEVGESTTQFLRHYRLDVASKLLIEDKYNRNITEIAYQVGFNDPKYFTRCFTKQYGVSPSMYKRE